MIKRLAAALISLAVITHPASAASAKPANPFALPSALPLQAPSFDKIKNSDYMPAFADGMKQQLQEIDVITANKLAPTFGNTIAALEKSGRMLDRVSLVFFALVQANTNSELEKIQAAIAPKLAEHHDHIYLNPALFARIKTLYQNMDAETLDQEDRQLLKTYYQRFVHEGANLNAEDKTKLRELNQKLAQLETSFQQKLIAAAKSGEVVTNKLSDLNGLSENEIAAITQKQGKDLKYVIPLQNTTQQPLLESLKDEGMRKKLFEHSWNRASKNDANDTRAIISEIAVLRAQKAKLLGYPNYAAYALYDQMAESPAAVHQFLDKLIPATTEKTKADAAEIQALIDKSGRVKLQPWDWDIYAEKIRKAKFDLDQNEVKPYFELNNVLVNGVFYSANRLYGISFKERHDLPVYHPDVRVFDVFDKDGAQLGLLYLDYFKRDNKTGGAWMSNFVQQSTVLNAKPVVYNVTNFTKPAKGKPALLTSDDVRTMFHEFGHALHGLFSNAKYPSSSSDVARDFVEMPSQFNEHWASHPEVLGHYARHYQTGKPLPKDLADKIRKSQTFNQAYALGEVLAAAALDMKWHELTTADKKQNVDEFEAEALRQTRTNFVNVSPRYRSSYFLHIWANGYSAAYYAYLWTEMLDDDIYDWFEKHGGLTRENGQRYRDLILSRGHIDDYGTMFKSFYGSDPTIEPMLKHRGLV